MAFINAKQMFNSPQKDNEGLMIINMNVKCDDDFLSVYSPTKTPIINTDVAEFIESAAEATKPNEAFTLRIYSNEIDNTEKSLYEKAIRTYYKEKQISNEMSLRRNNIIATLLFAFGIFVLALAIIIDYTLESAIWSEVIDIVAWVLIWEAADIAIFRNNELRVKKKRYNSFINMNIEYYESKN